MEYFFVIRLETAYAYRLVTVGRRHIGNKVGLIAFPGPLNLFLNIPFQVFT
jgi:hypothetical protein